MKLRSLFWGFVISCFVSACQPARPTSPPASLPRGAAATVAPVSPVVQPSPTVASPTVTVTPSAAIQWPEKKITVHNAEGLRVLQTWGKGRVEQVFGSPEQGSVVVFGAHQVTVYHQDLLTPAYVLQDVQAAEVSFTSQLLVTTHPGSSGQATSVKIRDLATGEVRAEVAYQVTEYRDYRYMTLEAARQGGLSDVVGLAFSPDGQVLSVGFLDGALKVWNLQPEPTELFHQKYKHGPGYTAFSPSGKVFMVGVGQWWSYTDRMEGALSLHELLFYRFPEMTLLKRMTSSGPDSYDLSLIPGGPAVESMLIGQGLNLHQVNLESGEITGTLQVGQTVEMIWPAEDGRNLQVYTVDESQGYPYQYEKITVSLETWEAVNREEVGQLSKLKPRYLQPPLIAHGHLPPLTNLQVLENEIVAWGQYGEVPFWWFPVENQVTSFPIPEGLSIAFSARDQKLITCKNGTLTLYSINGQPETFTLDEVKTCEKILLNHGGDQLAVVSGAELWLTNLEGTQLRYLQGNHQKVTSIAFSEDDTLFSAGTFGDYDIAPETFFWNAKTGLPVGQTRYPEDPTQKPIKGQPVLQRDSASILGLSLSRDNTLAVTFTENIRIWEIATGKQVGMINYDVDNYIAVGAISPDNRLLVLGDSKGQLRLWSLDTMSEIQTLAAEFLTAHDGPIQTITFNQAGTAILTGGADGRLHLWGLR